LQEHYLAVEDHVSVAQLLKGVFQYCNPAIIGQSLPTSCQPAGFACSSSCSKQYCANVKGRLCGRSSEVLLEHSLRYAARLVFCVRAWVCAYCYEGMCTVLLLVLHCEQQRKPVASAQHVSHEQSMRWLEHGSDGLAQLFLCSLMVAMTCPNKKAQQYGCCFADVAHFFAAFTCCHEAVIGRAWFLSPLLEPLLLLAGSHSGRGHNRVQVRTWVRGSETFAHSESSLLSPLPANTVR